MVSTFYCIPRLLGQPTVVFEELSLSGPDLVQPIDIEHNGVDADRLYIAEQRGTIRIIENGTVLSSFFLDISSQVTNNGERGLLGLAFHPDYPDSPYYYVNYIDLSSDTKIARFTVNTSNTYETVSGSEFILFDINQPNFNHNGGDMAYGPDGYLYLSLGDGGGAGDPGENGQDLNTLLGKLLRIDVDNGDPYGIPPDNPFVGMPDVQEEIWAYGLRNPWRFSFDNSGNIWIGDVGQELYEEINFQPAGSSGGENYGWDCYEGNHDYELTGCSPANTMEFPIFEYPHNCNEGCPYGTGVSVTGGFVYEGTAYPDLQGYYLCIDYGSENLWLLYDTGSAYDTTVQSLSGEANQIATFGEDLSGELYAANRGGPLYQVTTEGPLPVTLIEFTARKTEEGNALAWAFADIDGAQSLHIERSAADMAFTELVSYDEIPVMHTWVDKDQLYGTQYYRLKIRNEDGSHWVSPIRSVRLPGDTRIDVLMNGDGEYRLYTYSHDPRSASFEILDSRGVVVQEFELQIEGEGSRPLEVGSFPAGVYFLRTYIGDQQFAERMVVRR
jgi:glucose/arabinose dehydrogenase